MTTTDHSGDTRRLNYPSRRALAVGDLRGPDMLGRVWEVVEVLPSAPDGRTTVLFRPASRG